jgi:8-oxo-dGTP pyrophosphatase MutT (NUDIX family)
MNMLFMGVKFEYHSRSDPYSISVKGNIMGLFNKILSKLGLGKDEETPKAPVAAAVAPAKPVVAAAPAKPAVVAAPAKTVAPAPAASSAAQSVNVAPGADQFAALKKEPAAPAVKAVSEVDVVKQLEQMTEGSGLDWKVSIVDLLKVLKIDSSLAARKELAEELGCPAELIGGDYSKMNVWLHKTVLKKIAENGGNIPANLLD